MLYRALHALQVYDALATAASVVEDRKAGPDAPLVCSTIGEHTRAALSKPRFAHHAGVIIPVHAAKPGDIRPPSYPGQIGVAQDTISVKRPVAGQGSGS